MRRWKRMKKIKKINQPERVAVFVLLGICFTLILLKVLVWDYSFKRMVPRIVYQVNYLLEVEGFGEAAFVETFLPVSSEEQIVSEEMQQAGIFNFDVKFGGNERKGRWEISSLSGPQAINYSFSFMGQAIRYEIDPSLLIPTDLSPGLIQYLQPSASTQVGHPYLQDIYQQQIGEENQLLPVLKALFTYVKDLDDNPSPAAMDALTTARLGEGSSEGQSRLLVALAREAGIPARQVGGLRMSPKQKNQLHHWAELNLNGHWVPFDPQFDHFAGLPENYLPLFRGEKSLFTHSANVNFTPTVQVKKIIAASPSLSQELGSHPFNAYAAWQVVDKIGISLGFLKTVLMLPLGVLIVVFFRNIIGLQTFGLFLPALIAISCRETGLVLGLMAYLLVLGMVSLLHFPLSRWGIMQTPKVAIMVVGVIMSFLLLSVLSIQFNQDSLAYVMLFPIIIITFSAEKFAKALDEDGVQKALTLTLQTLIVASFAYLAMNSRTMETLFLAFPELFLAIVALNLLLGKWIGLRFMEFIRFRWVSAR